MFKYIKNLFVHPSAEELRYQQLRNAERELMAYEANVEYAIAIRDMLKARLARLTTTN